MIIICDIDGTVANLQHRLSYIQSVPKDWNSFHGKVKSDEPILPICEIVKKLSCHDIAYVTGRPERNRIATLKWLELVDLPPPWKLYMRKEGDHRDDDILKREIYERHLAKRRDDILLVLEDRSRVVKMWRDLGLTCIQVANGDY